MSETECNEECQDALVDVKVILIFVIVLLTLAGSYIPWFTRRFIKDQTEIFTVMNILSALSAGIIFGAFQSTLVPESIELFREYMEHEYEDDPENSMIEFPWSSVCIGGILILLLTIDRLAVDHSHDHNHDDPHSHSHATHALEHLNSYSTSSSTKKLDILPIETKEETGLPPKRDEEVIVIPKTGQSSVTSTTESIVSSTTDGHTVTDTTYHGVQTKPQTKSALLRVYVFFIALSIHSVFDGLALGSEQESVENLYAIIAAVLIHKVLDGLALGIPLYIANMNTLHTWMLLVICAVSTPIGIGIGMGVVELAEQKVLAEAIVISMSAGSFLFISLMELLPTALHDGKYIKSKLFAFFAGWLTLVILGGFAHANHGGHSDH